MVQLVSLILIRWIVIYPVGNAIQLLNNRGQMFSSLSSVLVYIYFVVLVDYFAVCCEKKLSPAGNRPFALRGHVTSFFMKMKVT